MKKACSRQHSRPAASLAPAIALASADLTLPCFLLALRWVHDHEVIVALENRQTPTTLRYHELRPWKHRACKCHRHRHRHRVVVWEQTILPEDGDGFSVMGSLIFNVVLKPCACKSEPPYRQPTLHMRPSPLKQHTKNGSVTVSPVSLVTPATQSFAHHRTPDKIQSVSAVWKAMTRPNRTKPCALCIGSASSTNASSRISTTPFSQRPFTVAKSDASAEMSTSICHFRCQTWRRTQLHR